MNFSSLERGAGCGGNNASIVPTVNANAPANANPPANANAANIDIRTGPNPAPATPQVPPPAGK